MDTNLDCRFGFDFSVKVYPVSFLGRSDLEKGDKILLPPSILQKISGSEIKGPIIFEIKNPNSTRKSHCGVMDFTADEGCAYLPRWMMQNLNVKEGEKLFFAYTSLEKGSYVKLQPQTDDFLNISNPKAVLEAKLRYFTCLTRSDIIAIDYNDKIYWINVVEVKPGMAILIIDTDIDVEFISPIIKKEDELYGSNLKINSPEYQKKNDQNKSKTEESSSEDESKDKDQKFYGKGHIVK